jgi:hypothetical protein
LSAPLPPENGSAQSAFDGVLLPDDEIDQRSTIRALVVFGHGGNTITGLPEAIRRSLMGNQPGRLVDRYCGQSPERLKAHMRHQDKFDIVPLQAASSLLTRWEICWNDQHRLSDRRDVRCGLAPIISCEIASGAVP